MGVAQKGANRLPQVVRMPLAEEEEAPRERAAARVLRQEGVVLDDDCNLQLLQQVVELLVLPLVPLVPVVLVELVELLVLPMLLEAARVMRASGASV
jgi:hypothetical protein